MRGMVRLLAATVAWLVACAAVIAPVLPSRAADGRAAAAEPSEALVAYEPVDRLEAPARFRASGYPSQGALGFDAPDAGPFASTGEERPTLTDGLTALQGEPPSLNADLTIPPVVLAAYRNAESRSGELIDGCYVPWQVLAGIGKVESAHGTFGGVAATMGDDGTFAEPILGPQLAGGPGTASIPDSDGGVLDGDTKWDRAVGPMQFIPTSWAQFGLDGNGDGLVDPNNVFDAAVSAAAHLCLTVPGDYRVDAASLAQAIYSYNRSTAYVATVLRWINAYRGIDAPPRELPTYSPPTRTPTVPTYTPPALPPKRQVAQSPTPQPTPSEKPITHTTPTPQPSAPSTAPAANPYPTPTPTPTYPWPACYWTDRGCTGINRPTGQPEPTAPPTPSQPSTPPPTEPTPSPTPAVEVVVTGSPETWPERVQVTALEQLVSGLVEHANAGDTVALTTLLAHTDDGASVAGTLVQDRQANGAIAPATLEVVYPGKPSRPIRLAVAAYRRPVEGRAGDMGSVPWITAEIDRDGAITAIVLPDEADNGSADVDDPETEQPPPTPQPTPTPLPAGDGPQPSPSSTSSPDPAAPSETEQSPGEATESAESPPTPAPTATPVPTPSGTDDAPSTPRTAEEGGGSELGAGRLVEDLFEPEVLERYRSSPGFECFASVLEEADLDEREALLSLLEDSSLTFDELVDALVMTGDAENPSDAAICVPD